MNIENVFIFLFLVLFPFGQIIRVDIVQPIDVVVGLGALYSVLAKLKQPHIFKYIKNFLFIAGCSWLFNLFIFHQIEIVYGLLYLFRLVAYSYFGIYVFNYLKQSENRQLLNNSLLYVSIISAIFGWIQLIVFPDLKPLFIWGWDMHLFRLAGTFFDPGYLGLIIVFGLILSIYKLIESKNKGYIFTTVFLTISLAFTYSRASYLAFLIGLVIIIFQKKVFKQVTLFGIGLLVLVFLLPTTKNHSIELFRSFSAIARIENYKTTVEIFKKSPVFGIGYDNMCLAYNKFIGYQKTASHACSGSDSSILYILATTGVVGLIIFTFSIFRIVKSLPTNEYSSISITIFISLLVHSMFSNSMFYSWIMGWLIIQLVLTL